MRIKYNSPNISEQDINKQELRRNDSGFITLT